MSDPIGAVLRDATALNHFYPELEPTLAMLFARFNEEQSWQKDLFRQETVTGAYYTLHAWMSPPNPSPFPRGQAIHSSGFGELTMQVAVENYKTDLMRWHRDDLADSRAPLSLRAQAELGMKRLMNYKDFVLQELLLGTASTYLTPGFAFNNIFGGTGLFSSSHSYNGQTWDNSQPGSGTSAAALIDDLWTLIKNFQGAVDSEGNPYFTASEVEEARYCIVIPDDLLQAFSQALKSEFLLEGGATAPSSNYTRTVFAAQMQLKVYQRLTDANNWYIFRTDIGTNERPFAEGSREGFRTQNWTESNSDDSRKTLYEGIRGVRRIAYAIGNPLYAQEVTN